MKYENKKGHSATCSNDHNSSGSSSGQNAQTEIKETPWHSFEEFLYCSTRNPKHVSHINVNIFPLVRSTIRAKIPFFHELISSLLRETASKNSVVGIVTRLRAARPRNYGSIHTLHKRLYSFSKASRRDTGPKPAFHSLGARNTFPGKGKAQAGA